MSNHMIRNETKRIPLAQATTHSTRNIEYIVRYIFHRMVALR